MTTYKSFSDNELACLIKDNDHAAYTEIYHRYFYLIFTHAYKKLRDEEQAKDIVQDVFAGLWFKRENIAQNSNLAGYLYIAVRNKIFDLFAHQQVQTKYIDSLGEFISVHNETSPDYRIREADLRNYIEKEIQALPSKMRLVFEMSRKSDMSYNEIAEKLNVSENNVSKQINNALRILKTKLGIIICMLFLNNIR